MPRLFSTATDSVDVANGSLPVLGAGTLAVLLRPVSIGGTVTILSVGGSYELLLRGTGVLRFQKVGAATSDSPQVLTAAWFLVAVTRAAGTVTPTFHVYDVAAKTWTHQAGGSTVPDGAALSGTTKIGNGSAGNFGGDIAIAGVWDAILSDAQVESLAAGLEAWFSVQPKAVWLLDQAVTTTKVVDMTGGGANEASLTGTSVSANAAPFSYFPGATRSQVVAATYSVNPSGGIVLGGSSAVAYTFGYLPSGGIRLGGPAIAVRLPPFVYTIQQFPTVKVEVAFNLPPTTYAPGVYFQIGSSLIGGPQLLAPITNWTDLSSRVRHVSITRGRNYELDRVETGTCEITFENRDSALDPTNPLSPWYPYVVPIRGIRVSASIDGVSYPLFRGFVESWPPVRRGPADSEVTVECVDVFAVLQQKQLDQFYGFAYSGARINQVLDEIGWPAGDRVIDPGASRVADADFTSSRGTALEHLQAVAESEIGVLFADASGRVGFHDRHHRRKIVESVAAFGSIPGTLPYIDLDPSFDAVHIYNDISVTVPDDDFPATAQDLASIHEYWPRSLPRDTQLFSWGDAFTQAGYLLARYKDPHLRFNSLTIRPGPTGNLWINALAREISDRISILHQPAGGAPLFTQDCFIEGVAHEIDPPFKWQTTWQLSTPSPADSSPAMIIGDPVLGQIGTTNVLVY